MQGAGGAAPHLPDSKLQYIRDVQFPVLLEKPRHSFGRTCSQANSPVNELAAMVSTGTLFVREPKAHRSTTKATKAKVTALFCITVSVSRRHRIRQSDSSRPWSKRRARESGR